MGDIANLLIGTWLINFVMAAIGMPVLSFIQLVLTPLTSTLFEWSLDYTTVPIVNTVILTLQGVAATAAVAVRVAVGVKDKILLGGGDREQSAGEYIYKSVVSIVVVALMPTLCAGIIELGHGMYEYVIGMTGTTLSDQVSYFSLSSLSVDALPALMMGSTGQSLFWLIMGVLVVLVLTIMAGYQFVKRQIEMLVISIVGPLVSIYAATEYDSDEVASLLKKLFGLCCVQWLQYLLVCVAIGCGKAWVEGILAVDIPGGIAASTISLFGSPESVRSFMFCLASFGAARAVPAFVDEYTTSGGRGGNGYVAGMVVRSAVSMPARAAKTVITKTP